MLIKREAEISKRQIEKRIKYNSLYKLIPCIEFGNPNFIISYVTKLLSKYSKTEKEKRAIH